MPCNGNCAQWFRKHTTKRRFVGVHPLTSNSSNRLFGTTPCFDTNVPRPVARSWAVQKTVWTKQSLGIRTPTVTPYLKDSNPNISHNSLAYGDVQPYHVCLPVTLTLKTAIQTFRTTVWRCPTIPSLSTKSSTVQETRTRTHFLSGTAKLTVTKSLSTPV